MILAAVRRIRIREIVILLIAITLPAIAQNAISQKKTNKLAVDALYNQGVRSLQKGDLAAARAAFEKVVRLAPNAPEGHNSLGWVLLKTGNLDEAVAQLRAAVKLKPEFVEAHINLANALAASRKSEGAIEAATTEARIAVKLAPSNSEAHRTLGRLLSFQQNCPARSANCVAQWNSTQLSLICTTNSERSSRRIRNWTKPRPNFPKRFACNQISRLQNYT